MLRTQYVVVEHDGIWKIRFEGRHFGPYPDERAAVYAAIEAAERAPKSGYDPRVMIQSRRTGELYVEWTRGDPYPVDMPRRQAPTPAKDKDEQSRRKTG